MPAGLQNLAKNINLGGFTSTELVNLQEKGKVSDSNRLSRTNNAPEPSSSMPDPLKAIINKYEISQPMAKRLNVLRDYEVVIVCDDSGSMNTWDGSTQCTRWEKLRYIAQIVMEIGMVFDSNGVDIHFLNAATYKNVKDSTVVDKAFARSPSGYTPLAPVLTKIFQSNLAKLGRDKKLLVFVCTDGVPTDADGNENIPELQHVMEKVRNVSTTYVSFLICTDETETVDYLDEWDREMENIDVTSNYETERQKVRKYRGSRYRFTFGDYVVKALVGAVDPEIDALNEPN
ncbi:unnamed protein product [Adineta ricciae]|uniref:VWFA domain-containing protein n=1 Tax=Adineta ricciae TaxID=249248 RepID=A0A816DWJ7_ADIRI|nr:unnamed protein product [Adineta ricciae]CAF1639703.1 unnamed protein product [Adineta ricciae]